MATMSDALKAENMKPCKCGREKSIFYCKTSTCASINEQPLYCLFCFMEKKVHPNHDPILITTEVAEWEAKWKKSKE